MLNRDFPQLPPWVVAGRHKGVPSALRRFGDSAKDLSIDFRLARRPELITGLLSACSQAADGSAVDESLLQDMPVGMRVEALLALAELTDARPLSWRVRCGAPACGEESEFELPTDQVLSLGQAQRNTATVAVSIGGIESILRRPTGLDQAQWQTDGLDSEAMLRAMLVSPSLEDLLATGQSLESIGGLIDEAMDRFDPLLGFHLTVVCPRCGGGVEAAPDLAGAALERLSRAQRTRIEDVHRLASKYHWSEREILDLPEWRRESYLAFIEAEAA